MIFDGPRWRIAMLLVLVVGALLMIYRAYRAEHGHHSANHPANIALKASIRL
jgi:hypothetical protein